MVFFPHARIQEKASIIIYLPEEKKDRETKTIRNRSYFYNQDEARTILEKAKHLNNDAEVALLRMASKFDRIFQCELAITPKSNVSHYLLGP